MILISLIIEIGTNSTKSVVASYVDGVVSFKNEKLYQGRLGEGLYESKLLSDIAINRNLDILEEIIEDGIGTTIIATQVLRSATNYQVFTCMVREKFGVDVIVLTPEEESICAFYSQYPIKNELVLDIGGGSTELIVSHFDGGSFRIDSKSFPIGAVFLKELYNGCNFTGVFLEEIFDLLKKYVDICEIKCILSIEAGRLTGIGGTFVTLGSIYNGIEVYDQHLIEGIELSYDKVMTIFEMIAGNNEPIVGLERDRADIMPFGTAILLYMMQEIGIDKAAVSCKGVRHGYFINKNKELLWHC